MPVANDIFDKKKGLILAKAQSCMAPSNAQQATEEGGDMGKSGRMGVIGDCSTAMHAGQLLRTCIYSSVLESREDNICI